MVMGKMIAGAIVGIVIILQGIYVWYIYMTTFMTEGNHVLFALSLFQIGVGVYILFRASKSNEHKIESDEYGFPIKPLPEGVPNVIERNNQLSETWTKTNESRDKLKLLEVAINEQEKKPMT